MNILLTGATGFLGSNLLKSLINNNHTISILVRSKSVLNRISKVHSKINIHDINQINFHNVICENKIDGIIHCATNYGRGNIKSYEILESNLIMPLQLIQAAVDCRVKFFINTDTILDKGISEYALSKYQFREWLSTFSQKIVCVNIALEHFYGASDNSTKFVSYIVQQLLASIDTIDLTKGEQKRDFIYIDDVISAFLLILNESKQSVSGYFEYEIGTGICISIRDFVELAKKLIGNTHTKLNFGAIPYRNNEVMETHVNTSKLRALGWKPDNLLIDGLSKMIKLEREVKNI